MVRETFEFFIGETFLSWHLSYQAHVAKKLPSYIKKIILVQTEQFTEPKIVTGCVTIT